MLSLSFKEYLESGKQLSEALKQNPILIVEFTISKYCSLRMGKSRDCQTFLDFRPRQVILIEWEHPTKNSRIFKRISVKGHQTLSENEKFTTYLSTLKIEKWLKRNTK